MYLTIKQQVKHLSKEDYLTIKELCHIAKNLTNEAIYNVRQYYFTEGKFLKYEKNYTLLKNSPNYKAWFLLNIADMQTDAKGNRVSFDERLKDIGDRYGFDSYEYLTARTLVMAL